MCPLLVACWRCRKPLRIKYSKSKLQTSQSESLNDCILWLFGYLLLSILLNDCCFLPCYWYKVNLLNILRVKRYWLRICQYNLSLSIKPISNIEIMYSSLDFLYSGNSERKWKRDDAIVHFTFANKPYFRGLPFFKHIGTHTQDWYNIAKAVFC